MLFKMKGYCIWQVEYRIRAVHEKDGPLHPCMYVYTKAHIVVST